MADAAVPHETLPSPADFAKRKIESVQEYAFLSMRSLTNLFRRPLYLADVVEQANLIGVGSLPIVLAAVFFTGAALALNSATTLSRFGALGLIGQLVSIGIVRELGPVLAGLVVSGRNAAGMASELGSMVVTEQIDAMRALGTDPTKKLVTPRVVSTVAMLFFLTILGDFMGLLGGYFVASGLLGLDAHQYWTNTWQSLVFEDVFTGLVKPVVFGYIIATIGCYFGLSTRGGTQGVGRSTTEAVVVSMILVIIVDVVVTRFLMITLGG
ncbi:MAG TPA: ABC transporter permease [Candidatus Limnocylindrales bacterium]|nr:ABC transporter permease [Candidatus Limnocylindrales bacterium]